MGAIVSCRRVLCVDITQSATFLHDISSGTFVSVDLLPLRWHDVDKSTPGDSLARAPPGVGAASPGAHSCPT
jgi:hypothetical protein